MFYGDNLIGSRLPSLTYMLSFPDTATLEKDWAAFSEKGFGRNAAPPKADPNSASPVALMAQRLTPAN